MTGGTTGGRPTGKLDVIAPPGTTGREPIGGTNPVGGSGPFKKVQIGASYRQLECE